MNNANNYHKYKGAWVWMGEPHLEVRLTKGQINDILANGGYFVRNSFNFDKGDSTHFWHVIKDSFDGMEELSTNKRNQVRKSLKTYDYRRVGKEEMLKWGCIIANKAIQYYKVKRAEISEADWTKEILADIDNIDYWMAFEKATGAPVAFAKCTVFPENANYNVVKTDPAYLGNTYPFYGLFYEMNRYYLSELCKKYVTDGTRSVTEHSNIQPFLENTFNFRKAYCDIQIVYKWWFKVIIDLLYPFRRFFKNQKIRGILYQEAIRRGQY